MTLLLFDSPSRDDDATSLGTSDCNIPWVTPVTVGGWGILNRKIVCLTSGLGNIVTLDLLSAPALQGAMPAAGFTASVRVDCAGVIVRGATNQSKPKLVVSCVDQSNFVALFAIQGELWLQLISPTVAPSIPEIVYGVVEYDHTPGDVWSITRNFTAKRLSAAVNGKEIMSVEGFDYLNSASKCGLQNVAPGSQFSDFRVTAP